jgi:thymidylate kinase
VAEHGCCTPSQGYLAESRSKEGSKGVLITFSGLDGAGKSTLIDWLQASLQQRNERVVVFHMHRNVGVYACLRFIRDRLLRRAATGAGQPSSPLDRTESSGRVRRVRATYRLVRNRIVWSRTLRRLIYPADLFVFLLYRLYFETLQQRVVIMDRYFYDTLVDVADGRHWGWLRLLERLTPTPAVAVLLDVSPEQSHARKREQPLEYLRERWLAYSRVFPWVRSGVVVRNDDLQIAKQVISKAVVERLAS